VLVNIGDVADGVLVSAIGATVRMITQPRLSRRTYNGMAIVGWMDTEALTRDGLPGAKLRLPGLSEADAAELERALERDEVQGALQALLAARLTDAPEMAAAKAREGVRLALTELSAEHAEPLSEYFDDKISALVADLEGRVGLAGLGQVRAEAYNSRIVALLAAIERQVAALASPDRRGKDEAEFLQRYRQQVQYRHGYLVPPDFERRRRIAVEKIYVNTLVHQHGQRLSPDWTLNDIQDTNVMDLAGLLDRTVLLGDPGGGKTTAANVLANFFASDVARKVPFLVTLRDYAAKDPPDRSVAGHIEYTLETLYQCPEPSGLVERLLLTGLAVVIFDGLDELVDTSRRRDVSERVEQFCSMYPLTPVLVTSRLVGYDQARLDDAQFSCYRLGGFADADVAEYAHKWFAAQDGAVPAAAQAEAEAFLAESVSAPDLRSNPLMLALMCILYRGAGMLPRERAGIYARCAELLFGKWDEQRRIRRELRVGDFVEPAIRHLAWWLFSGDDSRGAVTEREIVGEVTGFLHGRAFETEVEARAAAREFVEFCRGRMWVLSDAGTTGDGEKLYSFTHRTFLEYFAAAHMAAVADTPEDLARALVPRLAAGEWEEVSQLAIQLKDHSSDRGADRIYTALLDSRQGSGDRGHILVFLAESLGTARLSPITVRQLTRAMLDRDSYDYRTDDRGDVRFSALTLLFAQGANHEQVIADEMSNHISAMVASEDAATRAQWLQLALEVGWGPPNAFWRRWSQERARRHAAMIAFEANRFTSLRTAALYAKAISITQALAMRGGFGALLDAPALLLYALPTSVPYPVFLCSRLLGNVPDFEAIQEFAAIGRYLASHPATPWVRTVSHDFSRPALDPLGISTGQSILRDEEVTLGLAAVVCVSIELSGRTVWKERNPHRLPEGLAMLLFQYEMTRRQRLTSAALPDLPVPVQFKQVFRDWAVGRVDFVEIVPE
jgi:NACHT domain